MITMRKTTSAWQTILFAVRSVGKHSKKAHVTNNFCRASHKKRMTKIVFAVRLPQNARQTRAAVHTT
jgi:hypothetical protein